MDALKGALSLVLALRLLMYGFGLLIILTVDASPFGVGWARSQDGSDGERHLPRFGAKTFDE